MRRALQGTDNGARLRIPHGRGHGPLGIRLHHAQTSAHLGELLWCEAGEVVACGDEHAALDVARDEVELQLFVDLLDPAGEGGWIAEHLGHQGGNVAGDASRGFLHEGPAGRPGEDHAGDDGHHQEHTQEVEVDAREEPAHVSLGCGRGGSPRRAPS